MTISQNIHPSHPQHELELIHYKKSYRCDGCKKKGFGSRYRCEKCDFDLHEDCMFKNRIISHRLICQRSSIRNHTATTVGRTNRHPSHPDHELERKDYQKPYTCNGCREQGFGPRYRCAECNYELHQHCMFNNQTASHEFFKGLTFKFYNQPPKQRDCACCDECKTYCEACGMAINGFVYHCEKKNLDLHPCCQKLKSEMVIDGVAFRLRKKISSKCIWCNSKTLEGSAPGIKGWSYMSDCKKYHFHVYCATEMVVEEWKSAHGNKNALTLENLERRLQRRGDGNGGRGGKYWKIVKVFLTTIVAILLGDPTVALTSVALDLITGS